MSTRHLLISFYTLLRKEVVRFFRYWPQTLLPPVVTVALYLIIFGEYIGEKIGPVQGIEYVSFLVPGLIMLSVINSSFANVVGSFYISKFQRDIEELLVSPMPIWLIISGYICGGILRGFVVAALVIGVSLFFWEPSVKHPIIIVIFLFLTSLVFSLGGLFNGIFAKKFDDIAMFATFILVPLTYLGGVFYSVDALPYPWQTISLFNPILYMISGFRYGFYGVSDVNVFFGIAILIFLSAVLAFVDGYLIYRGIGLKE